MKEREIHDLACRNFLRSQSDAAETISKAIGEGDFETAQFQAHALYGLAVIIGEKRLAGLAGTAEHCFRKADKFEEGMPDLLLEIGRVLEHLQNKPLDGTDEKTLGGSKEKVFDVFDRLEPLLERKSIRAVEMLKELSALPKTEELVLHIESIEYCRALECLRELRKELEV